MKSTKKKAESKVKSNVKSHSPMWDKCYWNKSLWIKKTDFVCRGK